LSSACRTTVLTGEREISKCPKNGGGPFFDDFRRLAKLQKFTLFLTSFSRSAKMMIDVVGEHHLDVVLQERTEI
jgi:hypothetical protein